MSDILRLDPFQMIRSFTVPAEEGEFDLVPDLTDALIQNLGSGLPLVEINLCTGGTIEIDVSDMWLFESDSQRSLGGPLYDCDQMHPQTLIGRDSGERWPTFGDKKQILPYPDCGDSSCFFAIDAGDPGGPGWGRYAFQTSSGFSFVSFRQYLTSAPTLIDREVLDLEMPSGPQLPIVSIRRGSGFSIRVTVSIPHRLELGHFARIVNTAFHDREGYEIASIRSPTELDLTGLFFQDEDNVGYMQADYTRSIF